MNKTEARVGCEVVVQFDDSQAGMGEQRTYFDALGKYNATGMGNDKTGKSSMFMLEAPDLDKLAKDLGTIEILEVRKKK